MSTPAIITDEMREAQQKSMDELLSQLSAGIDETLRERAELIAEVGRLRALNAELLAAARAALEYDKAIQACADDPSRMSSFCSAQGEDLDTMYARWQSLSVVAVTRATGQCERTALDAAIDAANGDGLVDVDGHIERARTP